MDISDLHKAPNPLKLNLLSFSPITEKYSFFNQKVKISFREFNH